MENKGGRAKSSVGRRLVFDETPIDGDKKNQLMGVTNPCIPSKKCIKRKSDVKYWGPFSGSSLQRVDKHFFVNVQHCKVDARKIKKRGVYKVGWYHPAYVCQSNHHDDPNYRAPKSEIIKKLFSILIYHEFPSKHCII